MSEPHWTLAISVNTLVRECHSRARANGWYQNGDGSPKERNVGEMIALCHSELGEALEGHRKGRNDDHLPERPSIEVELADAIIRICDLAGYLNIDLGGAVLDKLAFNDGREDHKLENRFKEGGKAY